MYIEKIFTPLNKLLFKFKIKIIMIYHIVTTWKILQHIKQSIVCHNMKPFFSTKIVT